MTWEQMLAEKVAIHGEPLSNPSKIPYRDPTSGRDRPEMGGVDYVFTFKDGTTFAIHRDPDGVDTPGKYELSTEYIRSATQKGDITPAQAAQLEETRRAHQEAEADRDEARQDRQSTAAEAKRAREVQEERQREQDARQRYKDYTDSIKERAAAERESLNQAILQQKITAEAAAAQYERWMNENVVIPLKLAEEQRARTTEARAVEMENRRRAEAAATAEAERTKWGYDKGQEAIKNELAMLPYAVGPEFSNQFSQAANNLSKGKKFTGWTPEAFNINHPNFPEIARNATAEALASISPYAQRIKEAAGNTDVMGNPIPVTNYSDIQVPTGAPAYPTPVIPPYGSGSNLPPVLPPTDYPGQEGATAIEMPYTNYAPRTIMDEISTDPRE